MTSTWRLDGTYGSMRLGNWLLTVGELDRWWGPGWDGSLLLSSNARPIPAIARRSRILQAVRIEVAELDRLVALYDLHGKNGGTPRRSRSPPGSLARGCLSGRSRTSRLAPCIRFVALNSLLSERRSGVRKGCPATWMRSGMYSQVKTARVSSSSPEDEPGNQLGGYTVRWGSPAKWFPVSLYYQKTGESGDLNGTSFRIGRQLTLWGAETWWATQAGYMWRAHGEVAYTTCGDSSGGEAVVFDCAYTNHLFPVEGYRYYGRPVGDSIDGDGRSYTFGLQFMTPRAWSASMLIRYAELNRGGIVPDTINTVAQEPVDDWEVELGAVLPGVRSDFKIGLGFNHADDQVTNLVDETAHAFVSYQYRF